MVETDRQRQPLKEKLRTEVTRTQSEHFDP